MEIENENPNVYQKLGERSLTKADEDESIVDPFDSREIFGKYINEISCSRHLHHNNALSQI